MNQPSEAFDEAVFEKRLARLSPAKNVPLAEKILAATDSTVTDSSVVTGDDAGPRGRSRHEKLGRLVRACALIMFGVLIGSAVTWSLTDRVPAEKPQVSVMEKPQVSVPEKPVEFVREEGDYFPKRRIARRPETSGIPILFADAPVAAKRWRMEN